MGEKLMVLEIPAETVEKLLEEFVTINMFHVTHARDETVKIAFALSGKLVSSLITVFANSLAG